DGVIQGYVVLLLVFELRLDKRKFYVVGAGLFTGVTVALYPVSVIKTRLQIATKDSVEKSAFFCCQRNENYVTLSWILNCMQHSIHLQTRHWL
ncbi:hypothetical protein MKW98_032687, partial [Papaver atlanticum]